MRILLIISIILMGFYSHAGVITLDQSGHGDYTTFADALSNSASGDTIYVVGNGASYGNITLSSPRTILGNGYFGQSLGYHSSATFGTITVNAGAANSKFIGITIGSITFNESNISFISCTLTGSTTIGASISTVAYEKCYFTSPLTIQGNGVVVQNSIFNYASSGNALTVSGGVQAQLDYNTFFDGNLSLDTALVSNCIVNTSRVIQTPTIINEAQFGNKVDTETNLLFSTNGSGDIFFIPQIGSPALTSSEEGAESGAFGFPSGSPESAYVLSGLPSIPKLTELNYESTANTSSNLTISVQAFSDFTNITEISVGVFNGGSALDAQTFSSFTPSIVIDEEISLNTSLYGLGIHSFSVSVTDEFGVKSILTTGSFLMEELIASDANVTDLEYFIDTDPGFGLGSQITVSPSTDVFLMENLNTSGLSEGFHTLYVRAGDQTGKWGGYQTQTIYIESSVGVGDVVQIEALEYFVDVDPGAGQGTSIVITPSSDVSLIENLDLPGLSAGFHTVYLRGKLTNGAWGPYTATTVYVESSVGVNDAVVVEALEYFIDIDPGAGLATPIAVTPDAELFVMETVDLTGIATGFHTLYLRGKLSNGAWGAYSSQTIYVEASAQTAEQITQIEYFFDTDPGVGNGIEVSAALPAASINETISLAASSLGAGTHQVSIRAKDESGSWGHYMTQEIEVLAGTLAESVADGNWDDPGIWSGSAVPANIDSVVINNVVTLNVPTDTVLALTIASTGNLDLTGNDIHVRGRFTAQSGSTFNAVGGSLFMDGGTQTYAHAGNIVHGNLIFSGTGTKTLDYLSGDNLSINDSLHVSSSVSLSFTQSPELTLLSNADFVNDGSISSTNKWSLFLNGNTHSVSGGDFDNVTFQKQVTLNIDSDFNYEGDFTSGGFASSVNIGTHSINLGSSWTFEAADSFNFSTGGRFDANKTVTFSMVPDVPIVLVNIPSGSFDVVNSLVFAPNQILSIESGDVNLNSANFSGSGGISITGGSLTVINNNLTFGAGSVFVNDGGAVSITGTSVIQGASTSDAYSFANNSGSLVLDGTSISEIGGLGIALLGGTASFSNLSFSNGLGASYITFDAGFNGAVYDGILFENGPSFNVTIVDEVDQIVTFDNYGGSFGGPDFDNPGTAGTINWTNPQGVGSITVNTPNGEEELNVGEVFEITWTTENVPSSDLIEINLSTDGGGTYSLINDGTFDTYNGSFNWTVPDQVGTENVIQIVNTTQGISAESEGFFSIVAQGVITVVTPNGGEELSVGDEYQITWTTENVPGSDLIEINLSTNGGETYSLINDGTFDTYNGSFNWTVPDQVGTENVIQIVNTTQGISDESDGLFSIIQPGGNPVANEATNITSTSFIASWSNVGGDSYLVDVSIESDFATFVENKEGIETTETSLEINELDFTQTYYYRVRADHQGTESDFSNTISVKTTIDTETIADSTALVQMYNALGGGSWNPGVNWQTTRLRDWDRITLNSNNTRVENVDISGLGAIGDMPNPFTGDAVGGLSVMLELDASNNQITGLMDFSNIAITNLNVSGNSLEFDDLESIVGIATVDYSNQSSVQFNEAQEEQIEVRYTNNFNLNVITGGSANQYLWKRNGVDISSGTDFSDNGSNLEIISIDYDNMGEFTAEVTSTLVPDLTINVDPQLVLAVADFEVRVLGSDDQPIAENVMGALLETTRRARGFDTLEVAEDVASTFVFQDVVLGDYLTAVASDPEKYIGTYSGNQFLWEEADTIEFRNDDGIDLKIQEVPDETEGDGNVSGTIETDFEEDDARVTARRRAKRRKCGLRRERTGGRTEDDHNFELIAYGETNDNGEFEYGDLPQGRYRFFVEYPGIPLEDNAFVEFEVGEAGISDTDFVLAATITEDGIAVELIEELGVIFRYFKNLEIYPNPSSDVLNISYRHLTTDAVKVELVDLTGAVLMKKDLQRGYDRDLAIDVRPFETGIYLLRFYDVNSREKNMMTYRIIIKD